MVVIALKAIPLSSYSSIEQNSFRILFEKTLVIKSFRFRVDYDKARYVEA